MVSELAKPEFTCLADKNSPSLAENIVIRPRRVISSVLRRVSLTRFTIISRSRHCRLLSASHPIFFSFYIFAFPFTSLFFFWRGLLVWRSFGLRLAFVKGASTMIARFVVCSRSGLHHFYEEFQMNSVFDLISFVHTHSLCNTDYVKKFADISMHVF